MTRRDWVVLAIIQRFGYMGKGELCARSGLPVEYLESSLEALQGEGYLDPDMGLSGKALSLIETNRPKRAVILAAGDGVRMLPDRTPKGLLTLNDEPLIERVINQLHEAGVFEIYAVVGYRGESFEYLTDRFGVELIYNPDYATHDSLRSLRRALDSVTLENCYIVPSNLWFSRSPFSETEYFSWYGVSGMIDDDSFIRIGHNTTLVKASGGRGGNTMLSLAYLLPREGRLVAETVKRLDSRHLYAKAEWEEALFKDGKALTYAKVMVGQPHFIIRNYEQIGDLEEETEQRRASLRRYIARAVGAEGPDSVTDMYMLKRGMTNKLTRFSCGGRNYLLRIPGEGSNRLTDRMEEAAVYAALEGSGISDKIVDISGETGFKITEFWDNSRPCDPENESDVKACMELLRSFHDMELKVGHEFDIFAKLEYYEILRGEKSSYNDYAQVKADVVGLKNILDALPSSRCLCHIDSVSDNFLFTDEGLKLIDWEYAGMADPCTDIAMFCLYAGYDRGRIDRTIGLYYGGPPDPASKIKIYCYIAAGGLLWSQWCEYKQQFGVQYGEYSMVQYRYARKYAKYARELYEKYQKEVN